MNVSILLSLFVRNWSAMSMQKLSGVISSNSVFRIEPRWVRDSFRLIRLPIHGHNSNTFVGIARRFFLVNHHNSAVVSTRFRTFRTAMCDSVWERATASWCKCKVSFSARSVDRSSERNSKLHRFALIENIWVYVKLKFATHTHTCTLYASIDTVNTSQGGRQNEWRLCKMPIRAYILRLELTLFSTSYSVFFFFFGSLFVCVHIYVKHNRLYSLVSFFFSSSFIDGSRLMGILLVFHEIIRLWCQRQRLSSARLRHLMRSSWAELDEQWCLLNYFLLPPNRTRFRLSCLNMWFLHCYDSLFDSFWPFHRINYMVWFSHVYMYNIYKWSSECNASEYYFTPPQPRQLFDKIVIVMQWHMRIITKPQFDRI